MDPGESEQPSKIIFKTSKDFIGIKVYEKSGLAKLQRGAGYSKGETQKNIIKYLFQFPGGANEPDIRDFIKETMNISDPKSVKIQLEVLRKSLILHKTENKGYPNIWTIDIQNITPEYFVNNFINLPPDPKNKETIKDVFFSPVGQKYIDTVKDKLFPPNYQDDLETEENAILLNIYRNSLFYSPGLFLHSIIPQTQIYTMACIMLQDMIEGKMITHKFTSEQLRTIPVYLTILSALIMDGFEYGKIKEVTSFLQENFNIFEWKDLGSRIMNTHNMLHRIQDPEIFYANFYPAIIGHELKYNTS
jgi:hypothetical protein